MKSFRIYLPGRRVPTAAGLVVIGVAIVVMLGGIFDIDFISKRRTTLTPQQLKLLFLALGFAVVGFGWLILKLLGIPFSKREEA